MSELEFVVIQGNFVELFHDCLPFLANMREEELNTGSVPNAIPDNCEEEFDPPHQVVEEGTTSRVHLVNKIVEHLFVSFHEVDESLYGLVWVFLAHCARGSISNWGLFGSLMEEWTHVLPFARRF